MAILSAIRQNTDAEARSSEGLDSPMVLPPSTVQKSSLAVGEADYLGISKKAVTPVKKQGFFKSFYYGAEPGVQESGAGKVGDVVGSIFRVPAQKAVEAGMELWSDDVKRLREAQSQGEVLVEELRKINPEKAAQIEADNARIRNESGFGEEKTKAQLYTQFGAAVGEMALTVIPVGLLGKAGRVAWSAKEMAALQKAGRFGQYAAKGLEAGGTIGQRLAAGGVTGGAYGGMYGFLAGLEEGGDWEKAIKNIPAYTAMGAGFGVAAPAAFAGIGATTRLGVGVAKGTGSFVMKGAPAVARASHTAFDKLPSSIQRAILTEQSFLSSRFGETGRAVSEKFNRARTTAAREIGSFQDEATRLGMLDAPVTSKAAYKEFAPLRQRWTQDRDFRFAVRDALTHEGKFADEAYRTKVLSEDKHMADIVNFFDRYRKDRGLLAQQQGITDNLLDIDKYFSKYTPQIGLKDSTIKALEGVTDPAEIEKIYAKNSSAVDDMIEYGYRNGQWKTKAEGFKNYYDAMDAALNLGRVGDENNTYFQWLIEQGKAKNLAEARKAFISDLDFMQAPLTPRTASLDFQRKVPMPWNDPDPMRVMSYYVKKADERIATAREFGVNDELLIEMKKAVASSNRGQQAGEEFEAAIRSITGQVARQPAEQRFSSIVRAIETFHLAFSQILNVSTQLNYLISTDLKHWGKGFKKAYEIDGMREAVQRGVFVSDMVRQTSPYANMGDGVVDGILKYSGFTYTEMLNRATGVGVSKSWADYNLKRALTKMGHDLPEADRARALELFDKKNAAEKEILRKGYENTGKYAREFAAKFPDEEFAPVAGNIKLAESRLAKLEESISPKIKKLQASRKVFEEKMLNVGKTLTDENVMDLQETINILRSSIDSYKGGKTRTAAATAEEFSQAEVSKALDGVVKLRRSQMEKMIERLENQFDEARALGTQEPTMATARKPLSPEQKVTSYKKQIDDIDQAILSLENELSDKERLLNGIIDAYKIADKQVRQSNPEGFMYDDFMKGLKDKMGELPASEAAMLREMGIDPEEAIARGGFTKDEYTAAAQQMVESTQGGNNPLVMPGMSRTPMGKIFYQFKSFAYMQAQFIGKGIKRDLLEVGKNPSGEGAYRAIKFLTTVGVLYPISYGALRDVRDIITLKKSPDDAFELDSYFEGLGLFSAGGLFVDFLKSAEQGGTEGFILGPGIGDVIKYLEGGAKIVTGDFEAGFKQLRRQLFNQTGVGQVINNYIKNNE